MSNTVPTVRVKNPNAPDTYMVINQSDLKKDHVLWPQQAADYVAGALVDTASREAQAAVRIFGKLMARQLDMAQPDWLNLTSNQRADLMEAEEPKIDQHVAQSAPVPPPPALTPPADDTSKGKNWKKPT